MRAILRRGSTSTTAGARPCSPTPSSATPRGGEWPSHTAGRRTRLGNTPNRSALISAPSCAGKGLIWNDGGRITCGRLRLSVDLSAEGLIEHSHLPGPVGALQAAHGEM